MLELTTRTEQLEDYLDGKGRIVAMAHGANASAVLTEETRTLRSGMGMPPRPRNVLVVRRIVFDGQGQLAGETFLPMATATDPTEAEYRQLYRRAFARFCRMTRDVLGIEREEN